MKWKIISILLFLSFGFNLFFVYKIFIKRDAGQLGNVTPSYRLTNPLAKNFVDSDISEQPVILHYVELKPKIESEIQKFKAEKNIGIFLQDIQTGAWVGINEKEGFVPASLLKVPIAMAVLKKVNRDEIKLTDVVELTKDDLDSQAGSLYQKGAGTKLTVWEAVKIMILTSDNTAKNVLKRQLSGAELNAIFAHVGIPNPYQPQNGQVVTPRGYSRIFKALYFSTFLSADLSEKLLDLATDTQMENLISAGVPSEIQVSHKYGERPDGLSDCGIIYNPKNPYFLCTMTKGLNLPQAKELIVNLSRIIYGYVENK
jgi:beta-lactamase class A